MKRIKKSFVLLFALLMVLTMSVGVFAGNAVPQIKLTNTESLSGAFPTLENATEISVFADSQQNQQFLVTRQKVQVSPGLAASYGYTYDSSITAGDVTALDVLVKLHEIKYQSAFTKSTANQYLTVSAEGYVDKAFGTTTYATSFVLNDRVPHGDIWHEGSGGYPGYYDGYSLNQAKVKNNDCFTFFFYGDTKAYSDQYSWFEQSGVKTDALSLATNRDVTLTLKGYPFMSYGGNKEEALLANTAPIANARLAVVNRETGALSDIEGKVTDSKGTVTLNFNNAGTYVVSAYTKGEGVSPLVVPLCVITVTEKATYPVTVNAVPEDWENDLWLQYDSKALAVGDTATIYPRRIVQIIDNPIDNNIQRPNFHFDVVEGNSVSLSAAASTEKVTVTAEKAGTSVVMVTYDASTLGEKTYGASSVVNTAYVVYTVGEDSALSVSTDIPYDSYDTVYFSEGNGVDMPFQVTAEGAASVKVTCNGKELTKNAANKYVAPLENRSNIIGVVATDTDGKTKSEYKVVDARKIEIQVANKSYPGEELVVGNSAEISFKGISNPVAKLAGVYNPTFLSATFGNKGTYVHYSNTALGTVKGYCSQWDLATKNTMTATFTEAGTYQFTDGGIFSQWWGEALGYDKTMEGKGKPNLSANAVEREFSKMPDFSITVAEKPAGVSVTGITLTPETKTMTVGDVFSLNAVIAPENATNKKITWESSNDYYASVDADGVVTAKLKNNDRVKNVTITATTEDGSFTDTCVITIVPPAFDWKATVSPAKIYPGTEVTVVIPDMVVPQFSDDATSAMTYYTLQDSEGNDIDYYHSAEAIGDTNLLKTMTFTIPSDLEPGDYTLRDGYIAQTPSKNFYQDQMPEIAIKVLEGGASIEVSVAVYDYNAVDYGSPLASKTGVILDATNVTCKEKDSAWQAIKTALDTNNIPYENTSGNYISSINGIGEFDCSSMSGWKYTVNQKFPNVGVGAYELQANDRIALHYTTNYGEDDLEANTLTSFTLGGVKGVFDKKDKNGTKDKPYIIRVTLPAKTDITALTATMTSALGSHYRSFTPNITEATDYTNGVTFYFSSTVGERMGNYYQVQVTVEPDTDQIAADHVAALVQALPEVSALTLQDKDAVTAAAAAYDGLTQAQKALVLQSLTEKLSNLQEKLKALEEEAQKPINDIKAMEDVSDKDWFYSDVAFVLAKGIMKGTQDNAFAPNDAMTRGQFVTVLGRYAGVEDSTAANTATTKFSDVEGTQYYAAHIAWAAEKGIVNGVTTTTFAPNAP